MRKADDLHVLGAGVYSQIVLDESDHHLQVIAGTPTTHMKLVALLLSSPPETQQGAINLIDSVPHKPIL